jgi:hypothetical protein
MTVRTIATLFDSNTGFGIEPLDFGHLAIDANGDLFGTTLEGGNTGDGSVFEITYTNGTYASTPTTLYSFTGGSDGVDPQYGPLRDSAGDLFGTTFPVTGRDIPGTVFELKYANGVYTQTTLYSLPFGTTAPTPIMDPAGNLFGVTNGGNDGTIFEIAKTNGTYASTPTTLYTLTGGSDGASPDGPLIMDAAGDLFGTANDGPGSAGDGLSDGSNIRAQSDRRRLYGIHHCRLRQHPFRRRAVRHQRLDRRCRRRPVGVANSANADGNVVYEIPADGATIASVLKTLATFGGASAQAGVGGGGPYGGLVMDHAGNLFGTTTDGNGSVFEIAYAGGGNYAATPTTIATFSGGAAEPLGNLMMDASGDLFGTTATGGAHGDGVRDQIRERQLRLRADHALQLCRRRRRQDSLWRSGHGRQRRPVRNDHRGKRRWCYCRPGQFGPDWRHGFRDQGHERHLCVDPDHALHLHRRQ